MVMYRRVLEYEHLYNQSTSLYYILITYIKMLYIYRYIDMSIDKCIHIITIINFILIFKYEIKC